MYLSAFPKSFFNPGKLVALTTSLVPWELVPVLDHFYSDKLFSSVQFELPMAQL